MEGYSRDLLRGIGRGDAPPQEQRPGPARARVQVETEEVELSLGLSLGGRFGVDRKGEKLARSSSVAAILTATLEVAAPPALGRTSSLPVQAEASEGVRTQQGLDGWGSCRAVEPEARQRASLSPSSGSSDGEGLRSQDTLVRSASLPAGIDATGTEEWRKRKAAQSLKRLELKRKRLERRNSLTCNNSKEAVRQISEDVKAHTDKLHHATSTSHDNLSAVQRKSKSAFKGTATSEEHSPSPAAPPGEAASSATEASPPSSASSLSGRAASLGCRGDQQSTSGTAAARARSMGDVERAMMREMPSVFTKGLPNGNRMEGFLYKYRKGEEVRIVCICHGSFHTPAGFVEHAGGGKVANPLRHIVVNPLENM
ncbi:hypothetical protein HU200_016942 [Digitaria exilis]|uniref:Ninja-family protein n=1 Tax=Digitaria exilis TaxID=1010633 RepID=A0A835F702_9POAL|nr:hypothetical protein HU200_016942 [Digitaria exilis]